MNAVGRRHDTLATCSIVAGLVLLACVVSGLVIYLWWQTRPPEPALAPGQTATLAAPVTVTQPIPPTATPPPSATLPSPTATTERATLGGKPDDLSTSTEDLLSSIEIPVRDRLDLARRLHLSDQPIPAVVNAVTPSFVLGQQQSFCVLESDALRRFQAQATLRYIGDHSYWWIQDGYHVTDSDVAASAGVFESQIYHTDRDFFGSEWTPGVDNDPRIHIFIGNVPGVSGYFYSANEYSHLINSCSNEKEMFYVNVNAVRPGTKDLDATLAHEFQHMIHWYQDANEETWVNEGLSDLAMQLNGYAADDGGYSFTQAPDTQLTAWADLPEDTFPHYGASYLFMSYFLARFGDKLTREVVATRENGAAGFNTALAKAGQPYRFDDVFGDWVIANYLNDPAAGQGYWAYRNLDMYPLKAEADYRDFPVEHKSLVHQYAADYILLEGNGDLAIEFEGDTKAKVAPNEAHSGTFQWWSNRGDDSNMSLTRAFDLSSVQQATLEFWLWYGIEAGWDYAFVEVSTDGGHTWKIVPGLYTTTDNPSGNSFGPAWTGVSGDGDTPRWIQERVDLAPYAGQKVSVRFEYVTDDAVSRVGLMLDDIAIPQIGYFDDVEAGVGGWVAQGFARIDNVLPQRYLVQAIEIGDVPQVQRMSLDQANRGRLVIQDLGGTIDKVVFVVSGITPFTTEPAAYRLRADLTPRDGVAP